MRHYLQYFFETSWRSFRNNIWLNSLTIASVTFAFFILFLSLLIYQNIHNISRQVFDKQTITLFASMSATDQQLKNVQRRLESLQLFSQITPLSAEDAKDIFLKRYGQLELALDNLGYNPFPRSFVVRLKEGIDSEQLTTINEVLKSFSGIAAVEGIAVEDNYPLRLAGLLGLIIIFCLLISVSLLISNTIKLNIFSRRQEIFILRLVGATASYIRLPFVLEGALQALSAGVLALLLLFFLNSFFFSRAVNSLDFLVGSEQLQFFPFASIVYLLLLSSLVGVVASFFAVGRFLEQR